jgi:hypothetical protein
MSVKERSQISGPGAPLLAADGLSCFVSGAIQRKVSRGVQGFREIFLRLRVVEVGPLILNKEQTFKHKGGNSVKGDPDSIVLIPRL